MEERQLTLFDGSVDYYDKAAELNDNSAVFRVHASLIYKLGESLIGDDITALSELIKNAYDADAGICIVDIETEYQEVINGENCKGKIEISDNGCGMDLKTIVNGWLTLSNSPKKKMKKERKVTDKYKRYPLGDKGLGRLSVQKLGRYMQMITKMKDSNIEYEVIIPWGDFLKNTTIDKIPIEIKKEEVLNDKSYTKIIIKDLVNGTQWKQTDKIDSLSSSLSKIVSPFKRKDNTFHIIAKVNGNSLKIDSEAFEELLNTARAKYIIKYKNGEATIQAKYKNSFFYSRETLDKVILNKVSFTNTMIDDFLEVYSSRIVNLNRVKENGFILEEWDNCLFPSIVSESSTSDKNLYHNDPGEFECEIYEYSLDTKYVNFIYESVEYSKIIDREEYKSFIDRYHGIKVVRDDFLVQGFGEGDGGDWLGLSSTSKTSGKYFDLRNASVIGCVYLTGIHNSSLKETTNREGFVEDEYYKNFKRILDDSIKRLNKNRSQLNDFMREYIKNINIHSSENVDAEKNVTRAIGSVKEKIDSTSGYILSNKNRMQEAQSKLDSVKELVRKSPFIPGGSLDYLDELEQDLQIVSEEFESIVKERDMICNEIDAIQLEYEKLNERLQDLFELAGLGISVETFTHEFDTAIRNIKEKNKNILVNSKNETVNSLLQHINYVTYALDALRKQMSYFNPGLKYVRAERQIVAIKEFLKQHQMFYNERCQRAGIRLFLSVNVDFSIRINRGMLNQVFDNLFNNSEYWLNFSENYGYIDNKEYHVEVKDEGYVLIWDNGIGISRDIEKRLFEPFESKKEKGRGLGLYIVANNLKYSSSSIRLLGERNTYGNLYKFEINFSEIVQ